jgi:hypothetical protein
VISGFNTDIEFDGTVYHVQTEDKGLSSRQIMSLVYNRGTILASKRVNYDDLLIGEFNEKELADRVGRQHKLICAAVKAGRIGELKEMTARSAAASKVKPRAKVPVETAVLDIPAALPVLDAVSTSQHFPPAPSKPIAKLETRVPEIPVKLAIVETARVIKVVPQPKELELEPVVEVVSIIEDEAILPAEAVAVVSELSGQERPTNSKLSLELLGETKFKGGDRRTVNIMICRGTERKVVRDAQIMIKVLGSSFRPVIFHAKSDANGLARVHLQLPHFNAGRAALLIRAISSGEEVELRRVVTQG